MWELTATASRRRTTAGPKAEQQRSAARGEHQTLITMALFTRLELKSDEVQKLGLFIFQHCTD